MRQTFELDEIVVKLNESHNISIFQKMEWSANVALNQDDMQSTFMMSKNNDKIEVETSGNVVWKKWSSVFSKTITVRTPFTGWEENKVDGTLKYSAKKFDLTLDGYKGTATNEKSLRLYTFSTNTETKQGLTSYIATNVYG